MTPALLSLLTACQTAPLKYDQIQEGHWESRALIRDQQEQRSFIVNLSINAVKNEKLRVDATSTLGAHLASLVLREDEVRYLLPGERRFFFGAARPEAMIPVISVPMSPSYLHNLLFEQPITEGDWLCERDSRGYLTVCQSESEGLKISWQDRSQTARRVLIEHERAQVQVNLTSFQEQLESRAELFELSPPQGFRQFRLR